MDSHFMMYYLSWQGNLKPIPDLYDLTHVAGWDPYIVCLILHMFPGLDLYYADFFAQPLTTAREELDDLDYDRPT